MSLYIPDEAAQHIVGAYGYDESNEDWQRLMAALEALAPYVVAAELEAQADDADKVAVAERQRLETKRFVPLRHEYMGRAMAYEAEARRLRARARELRGGTHD